ncbi:MAG TPA: HAD-IIIA family hydrolase [Bacteroidales bacterium]|nr:HAD-IIIA family hydrolase [Bacteroidales bacterium]
MNSKKPFIFQIDADWTLFLDRDGVINQRIVDGYVRNVDEFKFIDHVKEAFVLFRQKFGKIIVVTNQQGIGKGIMSEEALYVVHDHMLKELNYTIDKVYYSPYLSEQNHPSRKPNIGMALAAKQDFPAIDFEKAIMVGDTYTDILFGQKTGMKTVLIAHSNNKSIHADLQYTSLYEFAKEIILQ